jgi:hypothetical protein
MIETASMEGREFLNVRRFTMYRYVSEGTPADDKGGFVCDTDDWHEMLAAVERERS